MTLTATANWQDVTVTGTVTFLANPSGSGVTGSIVNGVLTSSTGSQGVPLPAGPVNWIVEFSNVTKDGLLASIGPIAFPAFTSGSVDLIGMSTSGLAVSTLMPPTAPAGISLPVVAPSGFVIPSGKVFAVNNTITLSGTDGTSFTFPNASDTVTTNAATETLTNKTLTSPVLTTPVINGVSTGSGVASAPAASTLAQWDANLNMSANNLIEGFSSIATAGATTTLTITSPQIIVFTGSAAQTVKLPTTSVPAGYDNMIINQSSGAVTVQSSAGNTVVVLSGSSSGIASSAIFTSVVATPTTAANWNCQHLAINIANGKILSVNNSLTLAGTDGTTMTFPGSSDTVVTVTATQTLTGKTVAKPVATASGAQTMSAVNSLQVFTGSSGATWTLPAVAGNTGIEFWIKNRGSATLTVNPAGADNIYTTSAVATASVTAGSVLHLINDGTYWLSC